MSRTYKNFSYRDREDQKDNLKLEEIVQRTILEEGLDEEYDDIDFSYEQEYLTEEDFIPTTIV